MLGVKVGSGRRVLGSEVMLEKFINWNVSFVNSECSGCLRGATEYFPFVKGISRSEG